MDSLLLYLMKSGISLLLLYAVYWLFLSRDTFFGMNRVYLVASVVFSMLFPLLPLSMQVSGSSEATYVVMLDTIVINASKIQPVVTGLLETFQVLAIIYLTGVSIFLLRFLFQVGQLALMISKYGITRQEGMNIVFTDHNYAPFSFFNLVFINRKKLTGDRIQEIIDHEQVHMRQRHSWDLILVEIITIIQWFNPVVWFYRHSIKAVHEYLADEGVLVRGHNAIRYQELLLNQSVGVQVNDLTNNFNHSLIKKRIIMMTKTKSTFFARLKLLTALPATLLLVMAFTLSATSDIFTQAEKKLPEGKEIKIVNDQETGITSGKATSGDIFTVVEDMPTFPGGEEARMKYLMENIKYPEEARTKGIQGTVYVTFVVEKDGSISNVKVLRGIGGGCDEEAIRVVSKMPNWKPGKQRGKAVRVQFNMPFKFNLGNAEKKQKDGMLKQTPPPPPDRDIK